MNKEEMLNLKLLNEQNYNDSLIECINKLQQENKELKEKYLNAVSDYENEKSKNQKAIEYICNNSTILWKYKRFIRNIKRR